MSSRVFHTQQQVHLHGVGGRPRGDRGQGERDREQRKGDRKQGRREVTESEGKGEVIRRETEGRQGGRGEHLT